MYLLRVAKCSPVFFVIHNPEKVIFGPTNFFVISLLYYGK